VQQIPLVAPVSQFEQPSAPVREEPKGPRPIASIPVPGTPWSVVWSSDERMFFFNVTNHTSVWHTPEDLVGSEALQKILDNPPVGKSEHVGTVLVLCVLSCRLLYMCISLPTHTLT
jgi:transcription elongation regulator 1